MSPLLRDKIIACGIHLSISFGLACLSYLIIYYVWYPAPLFKATDVITVFSIMLVVDIVLGPLLTFIVYKKGKKTLKMDLAVIAIIQLSALGYGMYSMYEGRPVWITYLVDRFELIRANEVIQDGTEPVAVPMFGQAYHFADITYNNKESTLDIFLEETKGGVKPSQRTKFYRPFDNAKSAILNKSQNLSLLNQYNNSADVNSILVKYPQADAFIPLQANGIDMTVLINKKVGGEVVKIVDLRPW